MSVQMAAQTSRSDAAKVLRELGHRFVDAELTEEQLRRIRAIAAELTGEIAAAPQRTRSTDDLIAEVAAGKPADGEHMDHSPRCPVSGQENPLGLAMRVRREGDDVVADVVFDSACAGMPGYAHGGSVAGVLDDTMGFVLSTMNGLYGYTATMTVDYKAPVRIGRPVQCRGRLARRDGRKLHIESELRQGDGTVLARATALFIEVGIDAIAASLRV